MEESLEDRLEEVITSTSLKSNKELSKMILAKFEKNKNLQICVLIKSE